MLRSAPEIFGKHLTQEIGSPQDYSRNKEGGTFPESYDLRIPRDSSNGNDLDDNDIAGALDDMNLSTSVSGNNALKQRHEETKVAGMIKPLIQNVRRSYEKTNELARASDINDSYMPIKALN